ELYASGREHLRAERWREALKSFRRVRAIDKGYGGVADLIAEADAGLEEEETRGSEEREEEERKAYKGSQRVHVVDKSYGSVADLIAEANARRGDEKARRSEREEEERKAKEEARRRDVEAKEEAARRELERLEKESGERQAKERLYSEALEVFDRKDWGAAREKLRAAEAADPGNKEITAKLAEVERQQKLATLFDGGMRHMKDGRWAEALDAFQQVRKEAGYYKNVSIQIARAETGLRRLREKERERPSQHAAGETARTGQEKTDPAPERIADSTDEKPTPVTRPTPYTGPMFAVNTTPDADDSRFQFLVVGAVLLITLLIITAFVLWGEG
ncbi:MAG TPA: hypothetical protein VM936_17055, partial [Pyrinomonadaceae bacterium]|nr:hypothetical protein [Pyrinomonadaceae bacterium]